MKKVVVLIVIILLTCSAQAQISGGFYYGSDVYGNGFVYFQGSNVSASNLNIKVICKNDDLDEEKVFYFTPLYSGNNFTIGPADGWIWQPGEKLYIIYPNGKNVYWIYGQQSRSNPSFKGHGRCTYYNSLTRERCTCKGYKGDYGKGPCKNCGHSYVKHE